MSHRPNDPLLSAARIILLIGQGLMAFAALVLTVAIPGILLFQDSITAEMRIELNDPAFAFPILPVVSVMLLALIAVAGLFYFLLHMRRIVDSVGDGDPFRPENADRLTAMAWIMLGVQLIAIPMAALGLYMAESFERADLNIEGDFDFTGIVLVLTLFILARVFRHGAAMRSDLEGTV